MVRVIVSNHNTILHIEYACVTIGKYWQISLFFFSCIRDIHTQIQNLLQENDTDDGDNIEEDITLQIYFLQETIKYQCGVGHFIEGMFE